MIYRNNTRKFLVPTLLLALVLFGNLPFTSSASAPPAAPLLPPPGSVVAWGNNAYVANAGDNTVSVINTATKTVSAPDDQVPFTVNGTSVITGVTHLPGGLTQLDGFVSGNATHLGDFTGPVTRIEDHQGNFGTTAVFVGANGKDSVFLAVSGQFDSPKGDTCLDISTGTYTITGGTGAFANATGSGTIDVQIDLCAGTATGTYTGTISRPNSN